ncbi:MAG TPA: hypothetical protein PKH81_02355 [Treponemataceae bacterium]|nr:hypothetical protein [Treponemataceae bacterium]
MKRSLRLTFSLALLLCGLGLVYGAERNPSFPEPLHGEWVLYRDYSWKDPTWVGFMYYDDSAWAALLVTPATGTRVSILFRTENADGTMILLGQRNLGSPTPDDTLPINYLMGLLPDLHAWRYEALSSSAKKDRGAHKGRSSLLPPAMVSRRDIRSFGGAVSLLWKPEIAAFNLDSITASDGSPRLRLALQGRISSGSDNDFFTLEPPTDQAVQTRPAADITLQPSKNREKRVVDGVTLSLDSSWTMIADNTFFMGNEAMLIVDTLDVRLMGLASVNLPLEMLRLFSRSGKDAVMDVSSHALSGSAKRFRIESVVRDRQTGRVNRDIKVCIPQSDGAKCALVSLSVSDDFYQANKKYFESLF